MSFATRLRSAAALSLASLGLSPVVTLGLFQPGVVSSKLGDRLRGRLSAAEVPTSVHETSAPDLAETVEYGRQRKGAFCQLAPFPSGPIRKGLCQALSRMQRQSRRNQDGRSAKRGMEAEQRFDREFW